MGVVVVLRQVDARVRGSGNLNAGNRRVAAGGSRHVVVLIDHVGRHAQLLAAIVETQREGAVPDPLAVDRRVAIGEGAVDANAVFLVVAEATAHIGQCAERGVREVVDRHARQGIVLGPLGDDIDVAADAALRRHAVEEGSRSFQQLDALGRRRIDAKIRHQAVEPVDRDVAIVDPEAADGHCVVSVADTDGGAHGGVVVGQHLGDTARLLVPHGFRRIARDAERCFHVVLVAEQAEAGAARHLSAGKNGRQVLAELRADHHGRQVEGIPGEAGSRRLLRHQSNDAGGADAAGKPRSGKQSLQRFHRRHHATDARRRATFEQSSVDRNLQAALLTELGQSVSERLGWYVERARGLRDQCGVRHVRLRHRRRNETGEKHTRARGDLRKSYRYAMPRHASCRPVHSYLR